MTKGQKIGIAVGVVLVLGWIGGLGDAPEEPAPAAPEQPAPEPAPEPEPKPERAPEVPNDLGDDAALDALWFACDAGDEDACYDLWWDSPVGSEYERFADDQIEKIEEREAQVDEDLLAQILLQMVWDDMSRAERDELCDGFVLLGAREASQIVAEGSGGAVTPEQVTDFFDEVCRG